MDNKKIHEKQTILYYPEIDSLRFFAFLFVFLGHSTLPVTPEFFGNIAWFGVQLFFLISGFLLTKILVAEHKRRNEINIKNYFMRRILRIWPLYFAFLISVTLFGYFFHPPIAVNRLFGNLFFYDNLLSAIKGLNNNFSTSHLWSIAQEEQYYFLLPFMVYFLSRKTKTTIVIAIVFLFMLLLITKLIAIYFHMKHPFIYTTPVSADCFLMGCVLGTGFFDRLIPKKGTGWMFAFGLLLLFIIDLLPSRRETGLHLLIIYPLLSVAFSFIFIAIVFQKNTLLNSFFNLGVLKFSGKISFGLYLFHYPILGKIYPLFIHGNPAIQIIGIVIGLIATISIAALSYYLYEKPFLNLKKKFMYIKSGID